MTCSGIASFTAREVGIRRAASGAAPTRNHGSTAMQWPPTPGPGRRTLTRGWWFARRMASQTSTPMCSAISANSLASATLTSRKVFSITLTISAVVASVRMIAPLTKALYSSAARSAQRGRQAASQTVVLFELDQDAAGQDALGAVRDVDVTTGYQS